MLLGLGVTIFFDIFILDTFDCGFNLNFSTRHEDLLAQTTGIESLESVLDVMTSRISSLKDLITRISSRISEPFHKLESRTIQLSRLQGATDLLRRLIRLFYLTKLGSEP